MDFLCSASIVLGNSWGPLRGCSTGPWPWATALAVSCKVTLPPLTVQRSERAPRSNCSPSTCSPLAALLLFTHKSRVMWRVWKSLGTHVATICDIWCLEPCLGLVGGITFPHLSKWQDKLCTMRLLWSCSFGALNHPLLQLSRSHAAHG